MGAGRHSGEERSKFEPFSYLVFYHQQHVASVRVAAAGTAAVGRRCRQRGRSGRASLPLVGHGGTAVVIEGLAPPLVVEHRVQRAADRGGGFKGGWEQRREEEEWAAVTGNELDGWKEVEWKGREGGRQEREGWGSNRALCFIAFNRGG